MIRMSQSIRCQYCGVLISDALEVFRCNYCNGIHCSDCRLPEKHLCRKTTLDGGRWFNDSVTAKPLYHEKSNRMKRQGRKSIKVVSVVVLVGIMVYFAISPDVFFDTMDNLGLSDEVDHTITLLSIMGNELVGIIREEVQTINIEPVIEIPPTASIDVESNTIEPPTISINVEPETSPPTASIDVKSKIQADNWLLEFSKYPTPSDVITWAIVSENVAKSKMNNTYFTYAIPPVMGVLPHDPRDLGRVYQAIERGFEMWENKNENIKFEMTGSQQADILVYLEMMPSPNHIGLASYTKMYEGVIAIHIGDFDCNKSYVEWDSDQLTNTTMHEVGHILGLEHHPDEEHLMYGDDASTKVEFDSRGYNIPESLNNGLYEGQTELSDMIDVLDIKIAKLDVELEQLDVELTDTLTIFGISRVHYDSNSTVPEHVYNAIIPIINEQNDVIYEYNDVVNEYSDVVNEYSDVVDEYNCYSNIE